MTVEVFSAGVKVGNVAGFVSRAQSEGLSARAGLREFREAGGAIRDARWFKSWGEVAASKAGQVDVGGVPLDHLPPREAISQWSAGRPGQYATQVRVVVREAGTDEFSIRQFTHVTQGPHSGQDAIDTAVDTYASGEDPYQDVVTGAFVSGYYEMVGPDVG